MPHARWFTGATLNYAEHSFGTPEQADDVAVTAVSQTREDLTLTFAQLRAEVARVRAGLMSLGVKKGDRVVGYLPNQPEALVAFLATASHRRNLGQLRPRIRHPVRHRPLQPGRADSAAGDLRVHVRQQGRRPHRRTHRGGRRPPQPDPPRDRWLRGLQPRQKLTRSSSRPGRDSSTRSTSLTMRDSGQPRRARMVEPPRRNWNSNLCRSTTRCSSSSPRARRASRRPSSTATAASCSRR